MSDVMTNEIVELLRSIDRHLSVIANGTDNNLPPTVNPNQSYTRRQTARMFGISTWSVDRARKDGLLVEARRVGKRDIRITGESILEFHREACRSSTRVQKL